MAILKVDVVSAQEAIYAGEAKFVVLPGESGELGILPGHTPLISRIRPGTVKIVHEDDTEENIFVAGGILEVQPGGVTVLADTAIRAADLDEARAEEARKRAEDALRNAKEKSDIAVVEAELAMLAAQAAAARKFSKSGGRNDDWPR
jgi:F-type H+-transporting ATPase subunit epsilon